MELNPQPCLSDSTDEYLIDALPAIAAGISPSDLVILTFGTSDLGGEDTSERILGFLQLWMALPNVITEYYLPVLKDTVDYLKSEEPDNDEDLQSTLDQIQGLLELRSQTPADPMATIGLSLTENALGEIPAVKEQYGDWFADQRLDALTELQNVFSDAISNRSAITA